MGRQEKKNQLYQHYCQLQTAHLALAEELQGYEEGQEEYEQLQGENERLGEEISRLEGRREGAEGGEGARREQLRGEIRRAYEGIKAAEREDERIAAEY